MLKTDNTFRLRSCLSKLWRNPSDHFIRLHKMYNPTPVNANWEIEPGRRNADIHMLFVKEGRGTYSLGPKRIEMKKGQLFLVSNGYPHSAFSDPDDLIHMYSLRMGIYSTSTKRFLPDSSKNPSAS